MATEDARYRESSQFRQWSFSPVQLASMRDKANTLARTSIAERLSTSPPNNASTNSMSAPTSNANTPDPDGGTPSLPEFLTPAEEALLVTFYTSELLRAGDHAEMGDEIKATAAAFFRRFYVTNSIMTYPPQQMLIVALFFGCKAEGAFPRITDFAQTFGKEDPQDILAGEFLLCQGIRFCFDVKHPFRALRGAVMELRKLGDIDTSRIDSAERRARDILRFSPLVTDAYFHYTPSQIMYATLSHADRGLVERLIQETFHYVAPPTNSGPDTPTASGDASTPATSRRDTNKGDDNNKAAIIGSYIRDRVLGTIEACRDMLAKEMPERREHWSNKTVIKAQITPLRKKLNKCHDPDRWDLVKLQKVRREQALKKGDSEDGSPGDRVASSEADASLFGGDVATAQRDAKRRKVGAKGLDDPFGGAL
ncbi:cyclin-like protein [Lasiosphaeria hispida]|uniref:Cyclin-like protein n=1 Tax=Lasiosphaeria hispida TaxID=260671 RepID=A0AAJ0MHR2_9PEZI|nr:cyclin-like protein [Lasiosphaeria hispida]